MFNFTALKTILSNPPSAKFFGPTPLEVSAVPITQMLLTDESGRLEEPSAAFTRTYSSASESSIATPSSSMGSKQFKRAFERDDTGESTDSAAQFESFMHGHRDISDPEISLNYIQQRSRNSSTSSDGGHGSPAPASELSRRDLSGNLFTVHEYNPPGKCGHRTAGTVVGQW